MNRATIGRALRGTRWIVERFERLRTKTVVIIHDEGNDYSIALTLQAGGNFGAFLKEIRRTARQSHEQVLCAEQEQTRRLSASPDVE
jgi:hypothetical protein